MSITYAKYLSGEYDKSDYTPSGAVTAGDIVVVGDLVGICHRDIAAGELGVLGTDGGLYELPKGSGALTPGALIYWDPTNHIASLDNSKPYFGYVDLVGALTGDTTVRCWHKVGHANIGT